MILKRTVNTINSQTKLYFVDKLQEYDHLIDKKEEQLDKIDQEIKEKGSQKEEKELSNNKNRYEFDFDIIDLLNKTKYQDKNIFELNKKIENKFDIDYVSLIKKFVSDIKEDNQYQFCKNIKDKFSGELIYTLKSLPLEEQEKKLKEILDDKEYKIYKLYKETNKKNDNINNAKITIYVGDKKENYNHISKYIKTVYSKEIYKGIKIKYKNKIYDYSLNERNV